MDNTYDPVGGHTKEEADAAYAALFRELHGDEADGRAGGRTETAGESDGRIDIGGAGTCAEKSGGGTGGVGGADDNGATGTGGGSGRTGARRENVCVVGRRNPDTDSICAAIAYAKLKNEIDPEWDYSAYRAGGVNAETAFVLRYFGVPAPELLEDVGAGQGNLLPQTVGTDQDNPPQTTDAPHRKVILVDHNEKAHAVAGIEDAQILEIIDHHRLATIETAEPVSFRNQPVGSVCTIIYQIYREHDVAPDRQTAGLLCSGILSDTRMFRAPATTRADRLACAALANSAGIDIEAYAAQMFAAGEA
jgi:inorganic pyrophosphatase/exopolyphosphatase